MVSWLLLELRDREGLLQVFSGDIEDFAKLEDIGKEDIRK